MKPSEKKGILILIAIGLVVLGIIWFVTHGINNGENAQSEEMEIVEVLEPDNSEEAQNIENQLTVSKDMEGYRINGIGISEEGNKVTLFGDLVNTSGKDQDGFKGYIVVLNRLGKAIKKTEVNIPALKPAGMTKISVDITNIYGEAFDFRLEKK